MRARQRFTREPHLSPAPVTDPTTIRRQPTGGTDRRDHPHGPSGRRPVEFYRQLCPECGDPADHVVAITKVSYRCSECELSWQPGDRDSCARCGDPLGGTDDICHTCRVDIGEGSA